MDDSAVESFVLETVTRTVRFLALSPPSSARSFIIAGPWQCSTLEHAQTRVRKFAGGHRRANALGHAERATVVARSPSPSHYIARKISEGETGRGPGPAGRRRPRGSRRRGDRRSPRHPDAIAALPAPVRDAVLGGFADSLSDIYTLAIPIALLGFLVALFLPELPLRTSSVAPNRSSPT